MVTWDAELYAKDLKNVVLPNADVEDRLTVKYPPLLGVRGALEFHNTNLPLVAGPAIVTDNQDRELLWSLPGILSPTRQVPIFAAPQAGSTYRLFQRKILADTRCLEAQLTTHAHTPEDPDTKNWRTADTLYNSGVDWKSGSTMLSPAGFQLGHTVSRPLANIQRPLIVQLGTPISP